MAAAAGALAFFCLSSQLKRQRISAQGIRGSEQSQFLDIIVFDAKCSIPFESLPSLVQRVSRLRCPSRSVTAVTIAAYIASNFSDRFDIHLCNLTFDRRC